MKVRRLRLYIIETPKELLTVMSDTVISSFPPTHCRNRLDGFSDLYDRVREFVDRCETVWDLHSLLIKEATSLLFNHQNRAFRDLTETYRWVTNKQVWFILPRYELH
jgi:hypothetical protein